MEHLTTWKLDDSTMAKGAKATDWLNDKHGGVATEFNRFVAQVALVLAIRIRAQIENDPMTLEDIAPLLSTLSAELETTELKK